MPRPLLKYFLLATLVLPAQGGFAAEAPPAEASPSEDAWKGWGKSDPRDDSRLTKAFNKYLAREEKQVKDALVAAVVAMPTKDVAGNFSVTNPQKIKAKQAAAKALRDQYPPEFWAWLHKRDDIRLPLFLTAHPTPPQFVANLAYLWKAVGGGAKADRHAQLLLAASLRSTSVADAGAAPAVKLSPVEQRLLPLIGQGRKEVPEPLVYFIHHKDKFVQAANLTPAEAGSINLESLALVSGTYPQRGSVSAAATVLAQIARLETKVPDFKDGLRWPMFQADKAPYYLLNPLTQGVSAREQAFIWERFAHPQTSGTGALAAPRMVGYGKYGWEYESPEVKYKKSDWHPSSWPRILEDGGVCGRMAQLEAISKNTLGIPSCTAGQPTHCANMFITQDAAGKYRADIGQAVTGGWLNTWPHVPVGTTPAIVGLEGSAVSWLAMAEMANRVKPADYHFSLFCFQAAQGVDGLQDKIHLLKAAVNLNPYHLGAWGQLMDCSAQLGPAAFNSVVLAMGERLAYPDGPPQKPVEAQAKNDKGVALSVSGGSAAQTAKAVKPPMPPHDASGDLIMKICVAHRVPANYERMLAARAKHQDALLTGVRAMWSLMETLEENKQLAGDGIDPVFRKYAAILDPHEAGRLFRKNFDKALATASDVYGDSGSPILTAVDSFHDVGIRLPVGERVATLKTMCEKLARMAPKYQLGNKATLLYGQTFYLSCLKPNKAYASAMNQLAEALRASGQAGVAQATLADYQAEGAYLLQKGQNEDRKRLKKEVLEQIEKLRAEDSRRL